MRYGSLFSGIGGMDLGLDRAGMECAWQVEIDSYCRQVLAKHWPDVPKFEDIRDCGKHNLEEVDVIAGGFPCQPFSTAGDQRGNKHDSFLWPEMCRIISEIRPTWVIGENVAGIDGMALGRVVSDMEGICYEVAPPLEIPACAVGCDHRRRRIWILSHSHGDCEPGRTINAKASRVPGDRCHAGRMGKTHGAATKMDRLRGSGNAVVPDIAEQIGHRIMKVEAR